MSFHNCDWTLDKSSLLCRSPIATEISTLQPPGSCPIGNWNQNTCLLLGHLSRWLIIKYFIYGFIPKLWLNSTQIRLPGSFTNSDWNLPNPTACFMTHWWLKSKVLIPPCSFFNDDRILNNSAYCVIPKLWLNTTQMQPPLSFTNSDWNLHFSAASFMSLWWMKSKLLPPPWS